MTNPSPPGDLVFLVLRAHTIISNAYPDAPEGSIVGDWLRDSGVTVKPAELARNPSERPSDLKPDAPGGPPSRPCTCGSKDDTHPLTCAKVAWLNTPPTGPFPAPPSRPPIPESANRASEHATPSDLHVHDGAAGGCGVCRAIAANESECSGLPPPPPREEVLRKCVVALDVALDGLCREEKRYHAWFRTITEAKAAAAAELGRSASERPPEVESPSVSLAARVRELEEAIDVRDRNDNGLFMEAWRQRTRAVSLAALLREAAFTLANGCAGTPGVELARRIDSALRREAAGAERGGVANEKD